MFRKNPTPRAFAISGSAFVFFLLVFSMLVYNLYLGEAINYGTIFIIGIIGSFLSYFVLLYFLERFIYRKIKLIYKNIHDLKLGRLEISKNREKLDLGANIINEVNNEVQRWAIKKNREIARLKELENFRKDFLGNVFHEIKTPVFSLQGYLHTLKDGALYDEEVRDRYIEKSVKNIDRLEQIIRDLELITLKENNKLELELCDFDITSLVKDVFDALELQADYKDIEFGIKQSCDRPFKVHADRDKIRQILVNLVNNGIKYGKEGGLIIVGLYDMGDNILVEVTDNGIGIEQSKLNRLFERFYRVDESRYRGQQPIGGSGLGLSIVKHIVEAHDQTISVRSTIDVGSTFGFTLQKVK